MPEVRNQNVVTSGVGFRDLAGGIAILLRRPLREQFFSFWRAIFHDYVRAQYGVLRPIRVELPADARIPFRPMAGAYLSFIPFSLGIARFMHREFGAAADTDLRDILGRMHVLYRDAGTIFRRAPTTGYRPWTAHPGMLFIQLVDRARNNFPSLHVELIVTLYLELTSIVKRYAVDPARYDPYIRSCFDRIIAITEACLLTKQHYVIDIAGALAIVSAEDKRYTPAVAERFIYALFTCSRYGMSEEDTQMVRAEIYRVYRELMDTLSAQPGRNHADVLIDYLHRFNARQLSSNILTNSSL
jgi:hypothetical protein